MAIKIIFVDVDNTLVDSKGREFAHAISEKGLRQHQVSYMSEKDLQDKVCGPMDKVVRSDSGNIYVSRLRPGAPEFLAALKTLGPKVCALSWGKSHFVKLVLGKHGLLPLFDATYGREDYHDVPKVGNNGILVDDKGADDEKTVHKLLAMGAAKNIWDVRTAKDQVIVVPAFEGDLKDDALPKVLEAVRAKVAAAQ